VESTSAMVVHCLGWPAKSYQIARSASVAESNSRRLAVIIAQNSPPREYKRFILGMSAGRNVNQATWCKRPSVVRSERGNVGNLVEHIIILDQLSPT
jgi:hypothetical protein